MKRIGLIFTVLGMLILISASSLFSQPPPTSNNGYMRTDLISPSPTAANLGRYGNVPITYYTGLPNISIPIFTVEGTDLRLPITLSYNYSGFKPAEETSWVGLGWSLQAGGVITRTIGDKVDEDYTDSNSKYNKTPSLVNLGNQEYLEDAYKGALYDLAPDVFSFNFEGYSGKFVLYENNFSITPDQNLLITGNTATGFTIVTENGTKYEFTETEISMKKSTGYEPYIIPDYESSWYLRKITNAAGTESITLEYETEGPIYQYGTMVQSWQEHISGDATGSMGYTYSLEILSSPSAAFSSKVQTAKRLKAIHSEKYKVSFMASEEREDIDGSSYALSAIHVNSADDEKIKTFVFQTEYFEGGSNKFLKLKKLRQFDTTSVNYIQHEFEYENEDEFQGGNNAANVDHYGFSNGGGTMTNYFPPSILPGGANREPAFMYAKSGALKKITYPTGGSTEFEYAPNTNFNGQDWNYVYVNNPASRTVSNNVSTIKEEIDTFSTNYPQSTILYVSRVPRITPTQGVVEVDHSSVYEVKIERVIEDYFELIGTYRIDLNAHNDGRTFAVSLPVAGVYKITTRCDATEYSVSASIDGKKRYKRDPIEGKGGPGIRIMRITENPAFGTSVVRTYSYTDDDGFSTGEGLGEPTYSSTPYTRTVVDQQLINIGIIQMIDHTSVVAESPEQGLPFYYKRVTEQVENGPSVSRSRYHFYHSPGHNEADLIKQEDFTQEGGEFKKIRQVVNSYGGETSDSFTGISIFKTAELIHQGLSLDPFITYDWVSSGTQYIYWKFTAESTETLYSGSDSLVRETINYYDLNTHNLSGVTRKNSDGSMIYTKYKFPEDYHHSVTSALTNANVVTPLEEQVWQISPANDSVMLSGKIYKYNTSNKKIEKIYVLESATGLTAPDNETRTGNSYNTLISDSHYKPKVNFAYHSSGKMIGQQLTDDLQVSYLWAYPVNSSAGSSSGWKNYPVAEIRNATASEVFYTSFEESGSASYAKTGHKSNNGTYTIPGTFTGDYNLTYWKKTGSGPWQLVETALNNPSNVQIGVSGSWVDEVRLYPSRATIKTFAYLNGWGITDVNDPNNIISHFSYDPFGRLLSVRDDQGNIRSTYQYHYKNSGTGSISSGGVE